MLDWSAFVGQLYDLLFSNLVCSKGQSKNDIMLITEFNKWLHSHFVKRPLFLSAMLIHVLTPHCHRKISSFDGVHRKTLKYIEYRNNRRLTKAANEKKSSETTWMMTAKLQFITSTKLIFNSIFFLFGNSISSLRTMWFAVLYENSCFSIFPISEITLHREFWICKSIDCLKAEWQTIWANNVNRKMSVHIEPNFQRHQFQANWNRSELMKKKWVETHWYRNTSRIVWIRMKSM